MTPTRRDEFRSPGEFIKGVLIGLALGTGLWCVVLYEALLVLVTLFL